MKISHKKLIELLKDIKGSRIITLTALTKETRLRKKSIDGSGLICPYNDVFKLARVNGIINWYYEKSVNNQRQREGKPVKDGKIEYFEPEPRTWGQRILKTPFVIHKNKEGQENIYLELMMLRSLEQKYQTIDGVTIEDDLNPFLAEKHESKKQGVDKQIILRDYNILNILEIRMNQENYILT